MGGLISKINRMLAKKTPIESAEQFIELHTHDGRAYLQGILLNIECEASGHKFYGMSIRDHVPDGYTLKCSGIELFYDYTANKIYLVNSAFGRYKFIVDGVTYEIPTSSFIAMDTPIAIPARVDIINLTNDFIE